MLNAYDIHDLTETDRAAYLIRLTNQIRNALGRGWEVSESGELLGEDWDETPIRLVLSIRLRNEKAELHISAKLPQGRSPSIRLNPCENAYIVEREILRQLLPQWRTATRRLKTAAA